MRRPINADGERQVSARQVDMVSKWWTGVWPSNGGINRKFTPNRTKRFFRKIFPI
jgi:hypothetical protein